MFLINFLVGLIKFVLVFGLSVIILLFLPIKYKFFGCKKTTKYLSFACTFLFGLFGYHIYYENGTVRNQYFNILGFNIRLKRNKVRKQYDHKIKYEIERQEKKLHNILDDLDNIDEYMTKETMENEKQFKRKVDRLEEPINKQHYSDGFKTRLEFTKRLFAFIKRILKHILPRKLKVKGEIGFSDPSSTGYLMGIISTIRPSFARSLFVKPNFEREILTGEAYVEGRVSIAYIAFEFVRFYLNKANKEVIKKFLKDRRRKNG